VLSGAHRAVQGSNVLVQDGVQLSVADVRVPGASPRRPSVVPSMTIQELRGRSMLGCKHAFAPWALVQTFLSYSLVCL